MEDNPLGIHTFYIFPVFYLTLLLKVSVMLKVVPTYSDVIKATSFIFQPLMAIPRI